MSHNSSKTGPNWRRRQQVFERRTRPRRQAPTQADIEFAAKKRNKPHVHTTGPSMPQDLKNRFKAARTRRDYESRKILKERNVSHDGQG